jgi:hypothetical protein
MAFADLHPFLKYVQTTCVQWLERTPVSMELRYTSVMGGQLRRCCVGVLATAGALGGCILQPGGAPSKNAGTISA